MKTPKPIPLYWHVARGLAYDEGERRQAWALDAVARAQTEGRMPFGVLLQNEFHPTVTQGRSAAPGHLLADAATLARHGVALRPARRGGDVTGHGPGQWTLYPVVPLRAVGGDLHRYLRLLEEGVTAALARFGVAAGRREGLTGVWVGREKIAAVGVAVSRWTAWHGVAVNIGPESLAWTRWVVPCGIAAADGGVTSLSRVLGRPVDPEEARLPLAGELARRLGMELTPCGSF